MTETPPCRDTGQWLSSQKTASATRSKTSRLTQVGDGSRFAALEPVSQAVTVDYLLSSGGWLDALGRQRVANFATHPLVDVSGLAGGEVLLNTLMLDITEGWIALHRNNRMYQAYEVLSRERGLSFRVFAHTAGVPLIWYAVVPDQLRGSKPVSPHVFLQPSDNREGQSPADEEKYLFNNAAYFESDGRTLMKYVLPPVADEEIPSLRPPVENPKRLRNVVNFRKALVNGRETGEFTTEHWNIGAGLQKAFEHIGDGVPSFFSYHNVSAQQRQPAPAPMAAL